MIIAAFCFPPAAFLRQLHAGIQGRRGDEDCRGTKKIKEFADAVRDIRTVARVGGS